MAVLGHQIGVALVKALGLPRQTIGFTLRCYVNEAVSVECEYYPEDGEIVAALAEYELVPKEAGASDQQHPSASAGFDDWLRERTEVEHRRFMARTSNLPLIG
jgi:hypothetical protein